MLRNTKNILITSATLLSIGCTNTAKTTDEVSIKSEHTQLQATDSRTASAIGAQRYANIEFERGTANISDDGRASLRNLASSLPPKQVDEVVVLAWPDNVDQERTATPSDIELADRRAQAVNVYLSDILKYNVNIEKYNMAKESSSFAESNRTHNFTIKQDLETTGGPPVSKQDQPFNVRPKASSALVLVKSQN